MSYFQNKLQSASPFAQDYMSSDWTSNTQQWDTSTQAWLNTNVGTGHGFTGKGYLWGIMSGVVVSGGTTYTWANFTVADSISGASGGGRNSSSTVDQNQWGLMSHSANSMSAVADHTFMNYGSNTSWARVYSYYSSVHSANDGSRINVIRIEP